jgi:hypothetical protein
VKKTELIKLLQDNLRLEGDGEVFWENRLGDDPVPINTIAISAEGMVILSGEEYV